MPNKEISFQGGIQTNPQVSNHGHGNNSNDLQGRQMTLLNHMFASMDVHELKIKKEN
jgi:hypothetical protein